MFAFLLQTKSAAVDGADEARYEVDDVDRADDIRSRPADTLSKLTVFETIDTLGLHSKLLERYAI